MKTRLTERQSKRLFALGVPAERASESLVNLENDPIDGCDVFTIPDLISLVPKFVRGELVIMRDGKHWEVGVRYPDGTLKTVHHRKELIDALYDFVVYLIEIDKSLTFIY